MQRETRIRALSILGIVASVLIFFWYLVLGKSNLLHGNNLDIFYPYLAYYKLMMREGGIPLWNPYLYSGTPFHADVHAMLFYPFSLLAVLFEPARAIAWSVILHFCIAGSGMYLYLRTLRLSNGAALCGATIFTFSDFLVTYVPTSPIVSAAAWLPWVMLGSECAWQRKDLRWTVLSGAALALSFLAGHTQIYYYILLLLGMEAVARLYFSREFSRVLLILMSIVSLSVLLSAIQFLPTMQLSLFSGRAGGMMLAESQSVFWGLREFLHLFVPPLSEYTSYVGIFTIFLSGMALYLSPDRKRMFFLAGVILLCVMIVLGPVLPVYAFLHRFLPFFALFRVPTRIMLLAMFCFAVLAAMGVDALWRVTAERRPLLRRFWIPCVMVLLLAELWMVGIEYNRRDNVSPHRLPNRAEFQMMKQENGLWRMLTYSAVSNYSMTNRVENIGGYSPLFLQDYFAVASPIFLQGDYDSPFLDFLNVRYMKLGTEDSPKDTKLFINSDALPRAFVVHHATIIKDPEEARTFLHSDAYDPVSTVVLEEEPALPLALEEMADPADSVRMKFDSEVIQLEVVLAQPGILVTSEVFYPGWEAEVDGERREILKANTAFRALALEPGKHVVEMRYRPLLFRVGRAITVGTIAVMSVLFFWSWRTRRYSS